MSLSLSIEGASSGESSSPGSGPNSSLSSSPLSVDAVWAFVTGTARFFWVVWEGRFDGFVGALWDAPGLNLRRFGGGPACE